MRAPPVAGVLLTDAEIDHTAGLLLLRESAAPVRVFGAAGIERALTDGYPVLPMLERFCGAEWQTLEPGQTRRSTARASSVEPFPTGGDAPRYLTGWSSRRADWSSATRGARRHLRPGLARWDDDVVARFAASDLVLVDGTFWRDDELAALGISQRSAHDMGHVPLSGPGRDARGAGGARAPAQGARAHQQHEPDPARGLAEREEVVRAGVEVAYDGLEVEL